MGWRWVLDPRLLPGPRHGGVLGVQHTLKECDWKESRPCCRRAV